MVWLGEAARRSWWLASVRQVKPPSGRDSGPSEAGSRARHAKDGTTISRGTGWAPPDPYSAVVSQSVVSTALRVASLPAPDAQAGLFHIFLILPVADRMGMLVENKCSREILFTSVQFGPKHRTALEHLPACFDLTEYGIPVKE